MNLIKVSAELELTVHEFPEGSYKEQNKILRHLIGNGCSIYDHVMPKRLYTELHMKNCPTGVPGQCVSVLIDEEGRMKKDMGINLIASYLYETDKHRMPIVGNVLFGTPQTLIIVSARIAFFPNSACEIVCAETLAFSAKASCVSPFFFRWVQSRCPISNSFVSICPSTPLL